MFFGSLLISLRPEHEASHAGVHYGDAGRVADPPHGLEVREHVTEKSREEIDPVGSKCAETLTGQDFFGDLIVDLDVKASHRRYGAERADPRRGPLQARRGHSSAKKPRRKTMRGGRDPQPKKLYI